MTTTSKVESASEDGTKLLAQIFVAPWVFASFFALGLVSLFYETWVAMTIWAWFAPWPLPFGLTAGVGMNIAASLIFRSGKHGKDERTPWEMFKDSLGHYFVAPTIGLGFGWLLHWWTR